MADPAKTKKWWHHFSKDFLDELKREIGDLTKMLHDGPAKFLSSLFHNTWFKNHGELRILVTGKTGQGKSTLINGILGAEVAKEGARATRCTTTVTEFAEVIHGFPIKVFDSPGLQDRTQNEEEYIQSMRKKCKELSLVLYCTKMVNTRLTDDDKHAMKKLTKAFGPKFWNYAVFALTFANMEDCSRKDDRDKDVKEPHFNDKEGWDALIKQRFEGRLKLWEEELKQFLIEEVGVNQKIAERIPVVPTGDYVPSYYNPYPVRLPGRDDWFNSFWTTCCLRVKNQKVFLQLNQDRMVPDDNDYKTPTGLEHQQQEDKELKETTHDKEANENHILKKVSVELEEGGAKHSEETNKEAEVKQNETSNEEKKESRLKKSPSGLVQRWLDFEQQQQQQQPQLPAEKPRRGPTKVISKPSIESEQQQQPTQKPLIHEKRFMSTLPQGDQGVPTSEHSKSQQRSSTSRINEPTSYLKEEPSLAEGGLSFQDTSSDQITSSPKPAPVKVVEEELESRSSVTSQDTIIQPTPSDQVTSSSSPQETEPATSDQVIPSLTKPDSIVSEEPKPYSKPSDKDHLVSRKINVDKEFVEKAVEEAMRRNYGEKVAADSAKKTLSYIHKPASWFVGLLH